MSVYFFHGPSRSVTTAAVSTLLLWIVLCLLPWEKSGVKAAPSAPALRADPTGATVDVVGLGPAALAALTAASLKADDWAALFPVRVASTDPTSPPMLGSYTVADGVVRFQPRYPLSRGVHYRAEFRPGDCAALTRDARLFGPTIATAVLLPRERRGAPTTLAQVYPSSDRLPENVLRFYLQFSGPMTRGDVYQYIHLLGPDGKEVELPFLELGEELWDLPGSRLTLLIDPGRIKRGVKPREDVGPALEAGKTYTLVVDSDWLDAAGDPLHAAFQKRFTVVAPVETAIDPKAWKVTAPTAGGRTPLTATFPRPLDRALALRKLDVTDAEGRPIPGSARIGQSETVWEFTPNAPWTAGGYRLVVDAELEDVAGNRVGRAFEVDVSQPNEPEAKAETVVLPFTIAER